MLCPNCRAGCMTDDMYCHRCGTNLTLPSKASCQCNQIFQRYCITRNLPRLAVGVGALAVGVGLELLRRSLVARMTRLPRSTSSYLSMPTFDVMRDVFSAQGDKALKLQRGYEIHETAVYLRRVIRREA